MSTAIRFMRRGISVFVLRRVLLGLLTLLLVSVIVFAATQALPSDPARAILGRTATPESLAALRKQLNLTGSIPGQYAHWLKGFVTGDFVEMARLKGMPERHVLWRHAVPNAVAPAIQVIALNLAYLAGGIVVVEFVFGYPGIGSALVDAVANRDLPVVQALAILIAGVYVALNLMADVATILVSPRLRTSLR